jgi:DMSO reductase anchor subunit
MKVIMKQIPLKKYCINTMKVITGLLIILWSIDLIRIIFFNYQLSKPSMILDSVLIISYFIKDFLNKDKTS